VTEKLIHYAASKRNYKRSNCTNYDTTHGGKRTDHVYKGEYILTPK